MHIEVGILSAHEIAAANAAAVATLAAYSGGLLRRPLAPATVRRRQRAGAVSRCHSRLRRPFSRGSGPSGYPAEPLVSYRINQHLSVCILPALVVRLFWGARPASDIAPIPRRGGDGYH
jgi:hypothetical protein